MSPVAPILSWPETLLRRQNIQHVYVCGHELEPPLLSHVVNFPRLEIPLRGCYENQIELQYRITTVRLRPGTALFARPNCWNLPTWREPVQVMSILFGKKQIGISIVSSRHPRAPRLMAQKFSRPRPLTGPIPKILDALLELPVGERTARAFTDLARALVLCLGENYSPAQNQALSPAKALLEEVCVYLQSHYQYEVTRESVARHFAISPNYLSRIFQVHGHMTFSQYLMHVRTDRAKHLLRTDGLKLGEVAARCGYRDLAYFCRVFKKLAKVTPAEYRTHQTLLETPHTTVASSRI